MIFSIKCHALLNTSKLFLSIHRFFIAVSYTHLDVYKRQVRDSDGTQLSQEIIDMGLKVYSTLCLVRMDNEFAKAHKEFLQQEFLTSESRVAHNLSLIHI